MTAASPPSAPRPLPPEPAALDLAEASPREAIEALMASEGGKIYGLGLRLCPTPQDAEELVQETFLDAFRGWESFEGRSKPGTWLYTIARRACTRMGRLRAGQPGEIEPLEALLPDPEGSVADLGLLEEGPGDGELAAGNPGEGEILRREAHRTVEGLLGELPLEFRLPLVLVDLAELSTAEAAEVLGIPRNTVKTRVHRARLKLRQALDAGLPRKGLPPGTGDRTVCLAMLQAKQEALDRDVAFPYADSALCERCRSVFAALDLGQEACRILGQGRLPAPLAERLRRRMVAEAGSVSTSASTSAPT